MKDQLINQALRLMQKTLNNSQLILLRDTLQKLLSNITVVSADDETIAEVPDNMVLLSDFLDAKGVEGCSEKTIRYAVRKQSVIMKQH